MSPVSFPQANTRFGPPRDLAESQCGSIPAYIGTINQGSLDGSTVAVVAWMPDAAAIARINAGSPVYISMIGGLAPHMLTTDFTAAISPP